MYHKFQKILQGSKEYHFEGTVLVLRNYHTGEEIRLDLSMLDEEVFEELLDERA